MGEVTELFVVMLIVAAGAFAPLGYFIYKYTSKHSEPFGNFDAQGDSPSVVNDFAEKAINVIKSFLAKKAS